MQFLKAYANLPLGERETTIVVIDGEPLSWKAAKLEIEENTKKGEEILTILSNLKILS